MADCNLLVEPPEECVDPDSGTELPDKHSDPQLDVPAGDTCELGLLLPDDVSEQESKDGDKLASVMTTPSPPEGHYQLRDRSKVQRPCRLMQIEFGTNS